MGNAGGRSWRRGTHGGEDERKERGVRERAAPHAERSHGNACGAARAAGVGGRSERGRVIPDEQRRRRARSRSAAEQAGTGGLTECEVVCPALFEVAHALRKREPARDPDEPAARCSTVRGLRGEMTGAHALKAVEPVSRAACQQPDRTRGREKQEWDGTYASTHAK
jgi:hypothetical protein